MDNTSQQDISSPEWGKRKVLLASASITALLFLAAYFFTIYYMMAPGKPITSEQIIYLQALATVILLLDIIAMVFACYVWVTKSLLPGIAKNVIFSATVFLVLLLCIECFFLHYERTNGIGARWSYKLWDKKNLTHRTPFYFTDSKGESRRADLREPIPNLKGKKKSIWFIGDSFHIRIRA